MLSILTKTLIYFSLKFRRTQKMCFSRRRSWRGKEGQFASVESKRYFKSLNTKLNLFQNIFFVKCVFNGVPHKFFLVFARTKLWAKYFLKETRRKTLKGKTSGIWQEWKQQRFRWWTFLPLVSNNENGFTTKKLKFYLKIRNDNFTVSFNTISEPKNETDSLLKAKKCNKKTWKVE